ncbi:MAG: methyltransferase type 12 [Spirochaetes bacterium GWF1_51_8]|nr:MAG: methyltransferase type 12 [Spirochaetes bacterium GWF1_51_8]
MRPIEEIVTLSMDGDDKEIFYFLPYILQDFWEIGASPNIIIDLIKKHIPDPTSLKILDLGCGKGAVSVLLSKELNCRCLGIDAIKEFIDEAKKKAIEYGVENYCRFERGDIRIRIGELKDYDIIILGAIGPVFGDYFNTLTSLLRCLKSGGFILIDDGIIEDDSSFYHPLMMKRKEVKAQIERAGMRLIDEIGITGEELKESEELMESGLRKRCTELIERYPDKRNLFLNYIKKQEEESFILKTKVTCSTLVIKKLKN